MTPTPEGVSGDDQGDGPTTSAPVIPRPLPPGPSSDTFLVPDPSRVGADAVVGPVVLRFTALPEHVRTARLVAASVARRAGVPPGVLEGVRLAVGEACGRAVQRTESAGIDTPVEVQVRSDGSQLVIEVRDGAGDDGIESEEVAMLLMEGLADDVGVTAGPGGPGGTARLTWRR